jgi:hypothetical protein
MDTVIGITAVDFFPGKPFRSYTRSIGQHTKLKGLVFVCATIGFWLVAAESSNRLPGGFQPAICANTA